MRGRTPTAARSTTASGFALEVVDAVRAVWPDDRPLFVRISATDWAAGGWDLDQSVALASRLAIAEWISSIVRRAGTVPKAQIPLGSGYQVPFAERIRVEAGVATGAVGLITTAQEADAIVREGRADAVVLARALLRDPYWPLHAAQALGVTMAWPPQYLRAAPEGSRSRASKACRFTAGRPRGCSSARGCRGSGSQKTGDQLAEGLADVPVIAPFRFPHTIAFGLTEYQSASSP